MPGDAPPDAFLRFCHKGDSSTWGELYGESRDEQLPGDPSDKGSDGWFPITNFHFSLTGAKGKGGGGAAPAGGAAPKGAAPAGGHPAAAGGHSDEGLFQGVEVTMPTQWGSIALMKICTEFAIKKPDDITKIDKAYIYVRRPGYESQFDTGEGSGQNWFLAYYLFGVTLASFSTGLQCEDTFTLNYEKMQVEYWLTDPVKGKFTGASIFKEWLNSAEGEDDGKSSR